MIIVNTAQTYPPVARQIVTPQPGQSKPVTADENALMLLADITRGDWPSLSDRLLEEAGDYLLGTCEGLVTVTYRIIGHERVDGNKLRFAVEPAPELVPLIGQPQPLGPWKRGEARGTRRVDTPESLASTVMYDVPTWKRYVLGVAQDLLSGSVSAQGPLTAHLRQQWIEEQAASIPQNVHISVRPDGTIVIDVPAGQDVLVRAIAADL
ncbi:hypothetical protein [Brevibacterium sp.]|uniref:hypothetical protein n=1 Tax=Brevibacterium sp. TaxID=1701 RepID=UPI0028126438|nr:hypothetical protein [Brevibacterium sp.]